VRSTSVRRTSGRQAAQPSLSRHHFLLGIRGQDSGIRVIGVAFELPTNKQSFEPSRRRARWREEPSISQPAPSFSRGQGSGFWGQLTRLEVPPLLIWIPLIPKHWRFFATVCPVWSRWLNHWSVFIRSAECPWVMWRVLIPILPTLARTRTAFPISGFQVLLPMRGRIDDTVRSGWPQ